MNALIKLLNGAVLGFLAAKLLQKEKKEPLESPYNQSSKRDLTPGANSLLFYGGAPDEKLIPQKISAADARLLCKAYDGQNVKFQVNIDGNVKEVQSFIIGENALGELKSMVGPDRKFLGIGLTPGYKNGKGHTFIVTALASIKKSDNVTNPHAKFIHMLPSSLTAYSHLYDHLDICPTECGGNQKQIATNQWTM